MLFIVAAEVRERQKSKILTHDNNFLILQIKKARRDK
ncbi:hypothetical protein ES706_00447 [subsurface metagenome]